MTTMRLTTQTTHRCSVKGCTFAATASLEWRRVEDAYEFPTGSANYCTTHGQQMVDEIEILFPPKRWTVRLLAVGPMCGLCGGRLDERGRCIENAKNHAWLSRGFSCNCYVCKVAGGDCYRVGAYEFAAEDVQRHAIMYDMLKQRCSGCEQRCDYHTCNALAWLNQIVGAEGLGRIAKAAPLWSAADNYYST